MIAPARQAAYDVLRDVSARRADLPAALARVRTRLPDERDRALAGEIATGTLRWQGAFDHVIATFAKRPVSRLDGEVLDILRLSIFQLLHLDRIPASAAVNDAVHLARKAGKTSASGLVNALLRRVSRERQHLPLPARPAEAAADAAGALAYLSITLSHPSWLVARWRDRYGFDAAESWAQFDNAPARLMLRANTVQIDRDALARELSGHGVETEPARFAPEALAVTHGNPLLTPLAGRGLFVVQDEASQLVGLFAGVTPGERAFDACASPGGKTLQMAAAGARIVVAADKRPRRVQLLAATVASAGASQVRIVRADAESPLPLAAVFDCVLLDAPCSGLGTLRRDPDVKWRRSEADLVPLAEAQLRMLRQAAAVVRPGGRVVYSTCSSEPEENEEVVARFLAERPAFEAAESGRLPAAVQPFLTAAGHLRTLPFRDSLEAFFAAMLVKTKDLQ